jgi:hypothetical protein
MTMFILRLEVLTAVLINTGGFWDIKQCRFIMGHAIPQVISCWPLTMDAWVQSQAIKVGFVADKVALV